MAEAGIPVPAKQTARARRYVARKIHQARVRGAKTIDPRAVEFAGDTQHFQWKWWSDGIRRVLCAEVRQGEYRIETIFAGEGWRVWWYPRRGRGERIGRAASIGKATKLAETDHRYRYNNRRTTP